MSPSPVAAMMIDWLGLLFRPKTAMLPMLMPEVGPKSVSAGCKSVRRGWSSGSRSVFQTPPLHRRHRLCFPRGRRGRREPGRSIWLAPASPTSRRPPPIGRWTDCRPLVARQCIGLAQREDAEADAGLIAARLAQTRGRQRLLETQRPAVDRADSRAARCRVGR